MKIREISPKAAEPLTEMALTRADAILDLRGISRPLNMHLIKLHAFEFPEELRTHWKKEIKSWLYQVWDIVLKDNNRRMPARTYYKHLFDERFDRIENVTGAFRRIHFDYETDPSLSAEQTWTWLHEFHLAFSQVAAKGNPFEHLIPK